MDRIQQGQPVEAYDYSRYHDLFFQKTRKQKCPDCGSKDLSYHFSQDQTIISCQNMKRENGDLVCPAVGRYVFQTYHLLDDRFGQVIQQMAPYRYRSMTELRGINQCESSLSTSPTNT